MSTLLLRESSLATCPDDLLCQAEADLLCRMIAQEHDALREARLGTSVALAGARFRLLQADRNMIYRIQRRFRWFLKIPRNGNRDVIRREVFGAEAFHGAAATMPGCVQPAATRDSRDPPYVLFAELPGRRLNLALYAACLFPTWGKAGAVYRAFANLGEALGRFHATGVAPDAPPANRNINTVYNTLLQRLEAHDATSRAIVSWAEGNRPTGGTCALIHGNLKMENVLVRKERVCPIDFENSGFGSPCEDLSWLCSQIALVRSLSLFPWKRGFRALAELLHGYRQCGPYCGQSLLKYVTMRIGNYYLGTCGPRVTWPRIAGLPVSPRKLRQMVACLLEGDVEGVFPGISW